MYGSKIRFDTKIDLVEKIEFTDRYVEKLLSYNAKELHRNYSNTRGQIMKYISQKTCETIEENISFIH